MPINLVIVIAILVSKANLIALKTVPRLTCARIRNIIQVIISILNLFISCKNIACFYC
jgi:hypothetical protein